MTRQSLVTKQRHQAAPSGHVNYEFERRHQVAPLYNADRPGHRVTPSVNAIERPRQHGYRAGGGDQPPRHVTPEESRRLSGPSQAAPAGDADDTEHAGDAEADADVGMPFDYRGDRFEPAAAKRLELGLLGGSLSLAASRRLPGKTRRPQSSATPPRKESHLMTGVIGASPPTQGSSN